MMLRRATVCALLALSSCAWSNPESRPVWNAFEANLVPEDEALFYAALPVTVPLGLGAIVTDTLVAHPAQVVDDAWKDAASVWRSESMDFEDAYYTETALLPLRAAWTPVAFGGSWLGRSLFDLPPHEPALTEEERRLQKEERARERRERMVARLQEWLAQGGRRTGPAPTPDAYDERLAEPFQRALAGDALGRRTLHVGMLLTGRVEFGPYDARVGLEDPDPVVRYAVLDRWRLSWPVDPGLRRSLREDPVESVRLRARRLWPR